jgi:plastocyanin
MTGTLTVTGAQVQGGPAPASAGARTAAVAMADFEFKEKQVSVAPGAEITFQNGGEAPHTATLDDVQGADTGRVDPGQSKTLVAPSAPGSYSYKCTLHPAKMRGVIVVLGQSTPDPVAQPTATTAPASSGDQQAAAPSPTAAPSPPTGYTAAAGVSGGMKTWVIITLLAAAFLGGVGIAPFLRRRSG